MSYYKNVQTEFDDQNCVVSALGQLDLVKKVEIHTTPRKLKGWGTALAEIVLPKGAFGNVYEAGFAKKDGKFVFMAADDDLHRFNSDKMKQEYGVARSIQLAKQRGMKFVSRTNTVKDEQPHVKLIFAVAQNG